MHKETRSAEFCCYRCHCKFVAKPEEYLIGKMYCQRFAALNSLPVKPDVCASVCPECGELVIILKNNIKFIDG